MRQLPDRHEFRNAKFRFRKDECADPISKSHLLRRCSNRRPRTEPHNDKVVLHIVDEAQSSEAAAHVNILHTITPELFLASPQRESTSVSLNEPLAGESRVSREKNDAGKGTSNIFSDFGTQDPLPVCVRRSRFERDYYSRPDVHRNNKQSSFAVLDERQRKRERELSISRDDERLVKRSRKEHSTLPNGPCKSCGTLHWYTGPNRTACPPRILETPVRASKHRA